MYLSNESAVKQQGMELFNSEETMYGVLVCILFLALIWVQFHGLTNLQTALADFCHRLILAGSGTRAAEKSRSTGEVDGLYLSSDGNVGIQFADLLDTFAISCE